MFNLVGGTWIPVSTHESPDVCASVTFNTKVCSCISNPQAVWSQEPCFNNDVWSGLLPNQTPNWLQFTNVVATRYSFTCVTNAVGNNGTVVNGRGNWSTVESPYPEVCWDYARGLGVGESQYRRISLVYTSTPPVIDLKVHPVPMQVGHVDNGVPSFVDTRVDASNDFGFTVYSASSAPISVYASTNLSSWTLLSSNLPLTSGFGQFTDTASDSLTRRFYRVKQGTACSVDVVGFNRITKSGSNALQLMPIQFERYSGDSLAGVFGNAPNGAIVYALNGSSWVPMGTNSPSAGWGVNGSTPVTPGRSYFLGTASTTTTTFHGRVVRSYGITSGSYVALASPPHVSGNVTALGYPAELFDLIALWSLGGQTYSYFDYTILPPLDTEGWSPMVPSISPTQGFLVYRSGDGGVWNAVPTVTCP